MKPLGSIIQQNYWSFYPSEPIQKGHFNARHPVGDSVYKKVNLDFKMYSFGSKDLRIHIIWYVCERIEPMFPTLGTDLWVPEKKTNNHSNCIEHNVWQLLTLSAFNVQGRKPLAKVLSMYIHILITANETWAYKYNLHTYLSWAD